MQNRTKLLQNFPSVISRGCVIIAAGITSLHVAGCASGPSANERTLAADQAQRSTSAEENSDYTAIASGQDHDHEHDHSQDHGHDHGSDDRPAAAARQPVSTAPVVTADIQKGIEQHIARKTERDGGIFKLELDGEMLGLRLVRVHTEYLANLGPQEHFACVDLVSSEGNVYDVDFFLQGDPGSMVVTETIVHKINGKPFYVWKQQDDGTWTRVEVDEADRSLLGVIEGEDRFRFSYAFTLPPMDEPAELWLPLPQSDDYQTVKLVDATTPVQWQVLDEKKFGNKVIYMTLTPEHSGAEIEFIYDVHRREKSAYPAEGQNLAMYLQPTRLIPTEHPQFRNEAQRLLAGVEGEMVRARKLYDHVTETLRYAKYDDKYGRGDALYACNAATGNCTDYHSYFIALARAAGIPARFAIGSPIPSDRDEGGISGYHCWAEFYADGMWWPVDISESDKFAALSTYYFGHHPANRFEFSRGRDLVVEPGPESGPINFLAYPVLEIGGSEHPIKPFFSFSRQRGDDPRSVAQGN